MVFYMAEEFQFLRINNVFESVPWAKIKKYVSSETEYNKFSNLTQVQFSKWLSTR